MPGLSDIKLKLLMDFHSLKDDERTITKISKALGMKKYEVSRQVSQLCEMGYMERLESREIALTEQGKELSDKLAKRQISAENHLVYEGVPREIACKDAVIWAMNCTDETFNAIEKWESHYIIKSYFPKNASFTGKKLCEKIENGSFEFPFVIYRDNVRNMSNISMANKGFCHPCEVVVKNGEGTLILRVQPMEENSRLTGEKIFGKVAHLEYFENGNWCEASYLNDTIRIPMTALQFLNIGDDVASLILHGSLCLKITSTCGEVHMPESTAIFTLLVH